MKGDEINVDNNCNESQKDESFFLLENAAPRLGNVNNTNSKIGLFLYVTFTAIMVILGLGMASYHSFQRPLEVVPLPLVSVSSLRLELAFLSIEMMRNDTIQAANESKIVDISPLCELIEKGLDAFGIRGVYIDLFDSLEFLIALRSAAKAKGLHHFLTSFEIPKGQQPSFKYRGVPNDREFFNITSVGEIWWLRHFTGAITADKLIRDGSLLLDSSGERIYNASAYMKEIQRIQRLDYGDIMPFHAEHGFVWHYVARTIPSLSTYPIDLLVDFCGDLIWKDEYIEDVSNDIGRECRHGFGHAVFYVLAIREMGGFGNFSVQSQFRPKSGIALSEKSICEAYEICAEAPNLKTKKACKGGFRHSSNLFSEPGLDNSALEEAHGKQEKRCKKLRKTANKTRS